MADTLDVLDLDEAKAAIGKGQLDTRKEADLVRLITTVSRKLDRCIGPVVVRDVTGERHDGRRDTIELAYGPVTAISSVTEHQGTTAVTLTEQTPGVEPTDGWLGERYDPDPSLYSGLIVRTWSGHRGAWWHGAGNVVVNYVPGRVSATSEVDEIHKEAAVLILRNLWRPYESSVGAVDEYDVPVQNYPTFGVPRAVRDLLADEWQLDVGFGA